MNAFSSSTLRSKSYWVVVADEAGAVFYDRKTRRGPLERMFAMDNEDARKKTGELISDHGGRSFDSYGQGRHTMVKEKNGPKERSSLRFAKDIAERITRALHDGSCPEFALIAAPRFLGALRAALASAGNAKPFVTVDKDLVAHDAAAIQKILDER